MVVLKDKRGFIDDDRLDLSEREAVEFWMKRWGVTQDQLTAAHRKVGRLTKDIVAELGRKRQAHARPEGMGADELLGWRGCLERPELGKIGAARGHADTGFGVAESALPLA